MIHLKFTPSLLSRIRQALREDIGSGDITSHLIAPRDFRIQTELIVREPCVISGLVLLPKIFGFLDKKVTVKCLVPEGAQAKGGQVVARISGPARAILSGERVAINFVSKLTGIATLTREFVKRIKPYRCELLSTRKTTPLLRDLQKYAVRSGGASPHRYGLFDQYMIKDNHKAVLRTMGYAHSRYAAQRVRQKRKKGIPLEVEVDSLREIPWALAFRPDMILLDNFNASECRKAVQLVRQLCRASGAKRPLLEASGGISLANVRQIARSGVDRISVGALTHSARSIDFSLEVVSRQLSVIRKKQRKGEIKCKLSED